MKKKYKLEFRYDIEQYQSGTIHELELSEKDLNRLLRRGCIYASKDAKLTKEKAKEEVKKVEVQPEKQPKKELKNVVNKKSNERSKVQADSIDKE